MSYLNVICGLGLAIFLGWKPEFLNDPPVGEARNAQLPAVTAPSQRTTMGAAQDARITAIHAREGQFVKTGQLVIQLDDRVQKERVELARIRAESTLEVDLARVRLKDANDELARLIELGRFDAASREELRQSEVKASEARLELEIAQQRHTEAQRDLALQQAILSEYSVLAPFDGYVADRQKEIGDAVEAQSEILTIVALDPLEIMLECPLPLARSFTPGDKIRVAPTLTSIEPREGAVDRINRVAGAASQTVRIRILVPNPRFDWIAGMRVNIAAPAISPVRDLKTDDAAIQTPTEKR